MPKILSALFCPQSVALIGASDTPSKVGAIILKNIINSKFTGQIYPVNPNLQNVQGLTCYKNITEVPEVPDLAIIAIPAAKNAEVLIQIGEKGIKNVVAIAAGFKETGAEGVKLETELTDIAKKFSINLLGPNCLGFINNLCPINATFGEIVDTVGNARFISQSGAIAASFFDWCKTAGLGFSDFITLGNKADINENDILEYFANFPHSPEQIQKIEGLSKSRPIGMYLESISDGQKFLEITKQISKTDPIFILKPGKSKAAASAMQSHTGAIAGEDSILQEVLKEAGITRADTLEDFFDLARGFSWENLPLGPKVAIVSNAGGPAVVCTDAVIGAGLELAEFDQPTTENLAKVLPKSANVHNPIDVLGDALAQRFADALEIVLQTNQVDSVIVIITPQIMTEVEKTAEIINMLSKKYRKPIFCSLIGGNMITVGEQKLNEYKIPSFRFPERAVSVISAMWKFKKWQLAQNNINNYQEPPTSIDFIRAKEIIDQAIKNDQKALDNIAANEIISSIGIATPSTLMVTTKEEAQYFANTAGWPVVLKVSSPDLLHKKDVGGVITNIQNTAQLDTAWQNIIQKNTKIQIQQQIVGGVEVIIGVKHDPTFGPVLLFGAGGTMAELIADRNLHLLPIDISQAKQLVEKSKISLILKGYRGELPYPLEKLYEIITLLGKLAVSVPKISDIEINPVIVTHENVWAVDTKVLLSAIEKPATIPKFQVAKVTDHIILASTYHFFDFEIKEPFTFTPGQYISVKVAENRFNAYSLVTNSHKNMFSLLVDIKPGGPGSKFFENLKVNEEITFLGPFGTFTLNLKDSATRLLFLGTGSGITPLRSQIESALKEYNCTLPITLYFGLSYPYDLFWADYFQKLSLDYPNFKYKIAIWKPDNSWQGPSGFITKLLEQDLADGTECSAYLCGNQQMITDASNILLSKGVPQDRIYTEKL